MRADYPRYKSTRPSKTNCRPENRWISAVESYKSRMDSFKNLLGLPVDAAIELDRTDLETLVAPASQLIAQSPAANDTLAEQSTPAEHDIPPADAPIKLVPPSRADAGPLELDPRTAIQLALDNRLDLRTAQGAGPMTPSGTSLCWPTPWAPNSPCLALPIWGRAGRFHQQRPMTPGLRFNQGAYSALLTLDLPIERTAERNAYRSGLISLERTVRSLQSLEDQIKLSIRNRLGDMLEARESIRIQARSVFLAEKRVRSTTLFLEAGRAEIRDLLEAQDDLLSARNGFTSAAINYRIAELQLQRDTGLLAVDANGLWQEYSPKGITHAQK